MLLREKCFATPRSNSFRGFVKYCDLHFETPEENLAFDEVMLEQCDEGTTGELLRVWAPKQFFVVVGYGNRAGTEVNLEECRVNDVPVLRRTTGGGTVLQGPGTLNYSLFLQFDATGPCHTISSTNKFVMERNRLAVQGLVPEPVEVRGHTDLAINGLKFSGNAQRRRKKFLLFHGTFLLGLDIGMVEKTLAMPSREPDYRLGRSHSGFIRNVELDPGGLTRALRQSWEASAPLDDVPVERIRNLAREKYANPDWNFKF